MLDLSLALERVRTGGLGSGVLSLLAFRLRDDGVLWTTSVCIFSFWDPVGDPFWRRALPLDKPFAPWACCWLGDGVFPESRLFFAEGSGERRGGEWLSFLFLWYLLKVLAKYILKPDT